MTNEQILKQAVDVSIRLAKEKWGEEKMKQEGTKQIGNNKPEKWIYYIPTWQHCLQQMIINEAQQLNEDL